MRLRSSRLKPVAAALFLLLLAAATAHAREIRWESLDVTADLDAEGVLHVRERQHMVMTGDWNGGERGFRVRPGQDVIVHGITRIDPRTGQAIALVEGDLEDVDEYRWTSVTMLRWRSRLSTDPVFDATPLTYELDYSLYGALQEENGVYVLAHDFVFPERDGVIAEHTATLRIDPAWRMDGPRERTIRTGILPPGAGNLVRLTLTPASGTAVSLATSPRQARLVLALWAVPLLLLLHLFSGEWVRGRLAPLDPGAATDERWLEENLLAHPAEVVGAVWDRGVSADEVAALVARLTAEKTIETRVDDADIMHLTLKADRETLGGYVRPLVDGFFFDDRTETSTAEVREHYRKTGFDPAAKIRSGLEERAAELVGPSTRHWWLPIWLPTFLAFWGGVYLLYRTTGPAEGRIARILVIVVPALLLGGVGAGIAGDWRGRVDRGLLGAISFLVPMALLLGAAGMAVTGFRGVPILGDLVRETGGLAYEARLAATLIALAMANSIVNAARSRERARGIALRKRLASVRRYFELELERPQPALRDEWFPYVLAFGLDDAAQLWFKSYGAERASSRSSWSTSTSSSGGGGSSSGSSSPSSWSGGGGAFGGAGASGSWAAAAGGLSAAISAPSSSGGSGSSGGGGGGGGGGGSSGGGSGGGW